MLGKWTLIWSSCKVIAFNFFFIFTILGFHIFFFFLVNKFIYSPKKHENLQKSTGASPGKPIQTKGLTNTKAPSKPVKKRLSAIFVNHKNSRVKKLILTDPPVLGREYRWPRTQLHSNSIKNSWRYPCNHSGFAFKNPQIAFPIESKL